MCDVVYTDSTRVLSVGWAVPLCAALLADGNPKTAPRSWNEIVLMILDLTHRFFACSSHERIVVSTLLLQYTMAASLAGLCSAECCLYAGEELQALWAGVSWKAAQVWTAHAELQKMRLQLHGQPSVATMLPRPLCQPMTGSFGSRNAMPTSFGRN